MATYQKIATVTVPSGGASSISFSNIPQNFTDLQILLSARATNGSAHSYASMTINSVAYASGRNIYGDPSWQTGSDTSAIFTINGGTSTAGCFSNNVINVPNYTSGVNKITSVDSTWGYNNASTLFSFLATSTNTTDPVTTLSITAESANLAEYSTATLYGIAKK
jgi:hypothetical protein